MALPFGAYLGLMVYNPGSLEAALIAAVGSDPLLIADLKVAFIESAERQIDLLGRARCDANWEMAALRLKSLAASFGVNQMMALADEALAAAPGDPRVQRRLRHAIEELQAAA